METLITAMYFGAIVLWIGALWQVFAKAGEPGWAIFIPIYNMYVLLRIAGKPGWWLILFFVPFVNLVISILTYVGLAQAFGKGVGFTVGLILLPGIFFPILAFGSSVYGQQNRDWRQEMIEHASDPASVGSPLRTVLR